MAVDLREQLQASLGEAYQLERELGGGGMSRVFVALETALGRRVVVKVLTPELAATVSIDRFRREILFAAQLQHPHIVPLLAAGDAEGLPWFTMPFVTGESLRTRLERDGELPVAETVRVLRDVASALAYAHQQGVVHRDIKPDNVLLSHGVAVVTDFGVAKALTASSGHVVHHGGLTSMGVALGTPIYMSPEQASGDPGMDHRVDLYAFGVMAYEMLTGQPPFSGRTAQAVLGAHLAALPEPLTNRRPGVPHLLAMLIMRCLEKRAADRPQTAGDVMNSLDMLTTPSGGTVTVPAMPSAGMGSRISAATQVAARRLWPVLLGIAAAVAIVVWMRPTTAAPPVPPPTVPAADTTPAQPPPVDSVPPTAAAEPPAEPRPEPRAAEPRPAPRSAALLKRLRGDAAEARMRAVATGVPADGLARGDAALARADSLGRQGRETESAAELSAAAAMFRDAAEVAAERERWASESASRAEAARESAAAVPRLPTTPSAPPGRAAPAPDPRPLILAVIQQYSTAIESRNVDAIKRVYPGMLPKQALDWQQFFRAVDDIDVLLDVTKLDVNGNSAEAQLSGVYNFTDPGTRRARKENVSFVATLKQDGGRWVIQSLR